MLIPYCNMTFSHKNLKYNYTVTRNMTYGKNIKEYRKKRKAFESTIFSNMYTNILEHNRKIYKEKTDSSVVQINSMDKDAVYQEAKRYSVLALVIELNPDRWKHYKENILQPKSINSNIIKIILDNVAFMIKNKAIGIDYSCYDNTHLNELNVIIKDLDPSIALMFEDL